MPLSSNEIPSNFLLNNKSSDLISVKLFLNSISISATSFVIPTYANSAGITMTWKSSSKSTEE